MKQTRRQIESCYKSNPIQSQGGEPPKSGQIGRHRLGTIDRIPVGKRHQHPDHNETLDQLKTAVADKLNGYAFHLNCTLNTSYIYKGLKS